MSDSLFKDEKLIINLLSSLLKKGQAPGIEPEFKAGPEFQAMTNTVAQKLISKLEKQYAGANNISSPAPTNLKPENLTNLSELAKFIFNSQLKANGEQIIYSPDQFAKVDQAKRENFIPISVNTGRNETRGITTADYYAYLPGLRSYMTDLQNKAHANNNKLLQVYVGSLIDQINSITTESGLSRTLKPQQGQATDLPDHELLLTVDSKDLNNSGNVELLAQDIKNRLTFNAWLKNKNIQVTNLPSTIQAIYNRGELLDAGAVNEKEESTAAYIKRKMIELGARPGTSTVNTNDSSGVSVEAINQAVDALPLAIADINFSRIRTFFKVYGQLAKNRSDVATAMANAEQDMNYINTSITPMTNFSMAAGPNDIKQWLMSSPMIVNKTQLSGPYTDLLSRLQNLLSNTRYVIEDLKNNYAVVPTTGGPAKLNSAQIEKVHSQIGQSGEAESTIYAANRDQIQKLLNIRTK